MKPSVVNEVRKRFYLDSVALMRLSHGIAGLPGVIEAAMMMGTPSNRAIMEEAGLLCQSGRAAQGNDLVIGIKADSVDRAQAALKEAVSQLDKPRVEGDGPTAWKPRSLAAALRTTPGANLALISLPGDFAAAEARKALRGGLNVMIFSDNVTPEAECELKKEARTLGRLVMGPDCGTAIINGVPLAFANRVPRGEIGVIGASGTGMQEVTCLIARHGKGISQAIGVGGRDLSEKVGGITTLMAIDALDADPDTRRIVLVSKPPHRTVAQSILDRVGKSRKPFTICFIGSEGMDLPGNARFAGTLKAAAEDALDGNAIGPGFAPAVASGRRREGIVMGLYSGGTLAAEAQMILGRGGRDVASNAPAPGARALVQAGDMSDIIIDLGADEYTRGRPHPMIDPALRNDLLRDGLRDPKVGVILVDVVLGLGAHDDPASILASILAEAPDDAPAVVASVTGTEEDPQIRSRQVSALENAGVLVAPSNAQAAELALAICRG